jgi:hypothetical protein
MIPLGGKLMTGKSQNMGAGITYSDDGKNFMPFIGNPAYALSIRDQQNNKEIESKNKMLNFQENEKRNLAESIKKSFPIDYTKCFDDFSKIKHDLFLYYPTIKTYKFNILGGFSGSNKFISDLTKFIKLDNLQMGTHQTVSCVPEDKFLVNKIYVIRRKLGNLPVFAGWLSHSGLLLQTKCGKYYICEYGTEKNKNKVLCYKISTKLEDLENSKESFINDEKIWYKQMIGTILEDKLTVGNIRLTMEEVTCKKYYSIIFWNCHMAQENTRKELGLKVNLKYLSDDFRENLDYFNNMR